MVWVAFTLRVKVALEYPIFVPVMSKFPLASTQRSAVSVYGVLACAVDGVPEITPVAVSKDRFDGSAGVIEYLFAPQPVFVVAVGVIAFPTVTVCVPPVEIVMAGSGEYW